MARRPENIIPPVLEYACPVWQESIQRRAMRIIYAADDDDDYTLLLILVGLDHGRAWTLWNRGALS